MLANHRSRPAQILSGVRPRRRSNRPPLPAAVLDHLGQKLRVAYYERSARPKYVGDPALPVEFDPYLYRLEQKERAMRMERVEQVGLAAVQAALADLSF